MEGAVFVGRRRPLWKVALYGLITFGVYGRVVTYRNVKDADGHSAWFLDLRLHLLGVLLPVLGPLVVKWRLVGLVRDLAAHDATAPRLHMGWLRLAAFLPWIPLYHVLIQRHLNHHWTRHWKVADLEGRRAMLEERRAAAKTPEEKAEVERMEDDLRTREEVIRNSQEAAVAVNEARRARRKAEDEIRAVGGGPSRIAQLRSKVPTKLPFLKRGPKQDAAPEAESQAAAPSPEIAPPAHEPEPAPPARRGRFSPIPPEPEPAEPEPQPQPVSARGDLPDPADPRLSGKEQKALKNYYSEKAEREAKAAKKHEKAVEKARKKGDPEPPAPLDEPSKAEVKWRAKYEKARAKREKKEEKERSKEARAAAKAAPPNEGESAPEPRRRLRLFSRVKAEAPVPELPAEVPPPLEPPAPEPAAEATKPRAKPRPKASKAKAKR